MRGSSRRASVRRALHRFADFVRHETDICNATALFFSLVAFSVVPITYLHSTLIVNQAYAQALALVRYRRQLMYFLFSRKWDHIVNVFLSVTPGLLSCWRWLMRSCWKQAAGSSAISLAKVFEPSVTMAERLHEPGPIELEREWARRPPVRPAL